MARPHLSGPRRRPSLRGLLALGLALAALGCAAPLGAADRDQGSAGPGTQAAASAPWTYTLRVAEPTTQFVELAIDVPPSPAADTRLAMPAWTPGSYLIRDFARHVYDLRAHDGAGDPLPVRKLDKQTWQVEHGAGVGFQVTYRVFSDELSVRTNYLGDTLALLNGAATFLYEPGGTGRPGRLRVELPRGWQMETALPAEDGQWVAESYDQLVDSPLLLGAPERRSFTVANASFDYLLAANVEHGANVDRLAADAKAMVEAFHAIMGDFPFERYVFITIVDPAGGGGLEHATSTAMILRPQGFAEGGSAGYDRAQRLLAHEFFHLWNVKRIHDRVLGPFDYSREVYTELLWFHEGFTVAMEKRALLRAGRLSGEAFLTELADDYNAFLRRPGRDHTPIAQLSRDAWINAYQPSGAHWNTSVSYYQKGGLLGHALDAELRARSAGSLEGMFRALWAGRDPATQRRPITAEDVIDAASAQAGEDMRWFFERHVYGTEAIDLPGALERLGVEVTATEDPDPYLGLHAPGRSITRIDAHSPAERAGLMVGDELVAADGRKVEGLDDLRRELELDREITLGVFRRGKQIERTIRPVASPHQTWRFALPEQPSEALLQWVSASSSS